MGNKACVCQYIDKRVCYNNPVYHAIKSRIGLDWLISINAVIRSEKGTVAIFTSDKHPPTNTVINHGIRYYRQSQ